LSGYNADKLEQYFYSRVPPERRPKYIHKIPSKSDPEKTIYDEKDDLSINEKSPENEPTLPLPASLQSSKTPSVHSNGSKRVKIPFLSKTFSLKYHAKDVSPEYLKPQAEMTEKEKKAYKKKFSGNEEGGKVIGKDNKAYDQSLIFALSNTFFIPFWICESNLIHSHCCVNS
jgi:hypothetical protein